MKNNYKRILLRAGLIAVVGVLAAVPSPSGRPFTEDQRIGNPGNPQGGSKTPSPVTIDRITHNKSNIVTTIDNWGLIGGYPGYFPSGAWPRNSGHDYLAEIRYWMGAVVNGDTLVANSYDDLQGMPMPINGSDDYTIYLSTDTNRYYQYDPTDTVGISDNRPAFGWRVWDPVGADWEYNETYNSLVSDFEPSGPTSLQDSYYRFNDASLGTSLMGLELTHHGMAWNYCYNEDFMFFVMEITNTSSNDYAEFAVGIYVDIDVGGLDGQGSNGNQSDAVVYDVADNWAYIYDVVGIDPGWGPLAPTGVMGTKLLETPQGIGMTALRTDDWSYLPDDDPGRFALINSTQFDTPLPPTDQFYIQCVRGINLTAGSTVRVVYALVAGQDSTEFVANAAMAQQVYDNYFIGPMPPNTPSLTARASDRKVYLSWNDTAEVSLDPLSGDNDFVGYKLYRSENEGKTWGTVNYNTGNSCMNLDYLPIATYTVNNPGDPIQHSYVDTGLYNGVDYWYCLAAFDRGDTIVDPLQSGFGVAGEVSNIVSVRPVNNPAGYYDAAATVEHDYSGGDEPSDGEVFPLVFDATDLQGDDYQITFQDFPDTTFWHLINITTGDTLLKNQTLANADAGMYKVVEGLRVVVHDGDIDPRSYGQVAFGGADTTLVMGSFYGPGLNALFGVEDYIFGHAHFRSTYELRYTGDSTLASWMLDGYYGSSYPYWVPFEVWNTTTNQRVSLAVYDFELDDDWDPYDLLQIVNYPYDSLNLVTDSAYPYYYSWLFGFDDVVYNPQVGDVFAVEGAPLNGPDDVFAFKVDGINASQASNDLSKIRVVPNPYFVQFSSMVETAPGEVALEFRRVPDVCTIRIYSLSGDLVKTIEHNGTGAARWNLQSVDNQQVASGMYIYHVESQYGDHMGRFAVIK